MSYMTEAMVKLVANEIITKASIERGEKSPLPDEEKRNLASKVKPRIESDENVEGIDSIDFFESYVLFTVKLKDKAGYMLAGFRYDELGRLAQSRGS